MRSMEILKELESISPLLAGMDRKNIFSCPEGYFDGLTVDTLKKIEVSSSSFKAVSAPEGHFENLSSAILNKIKAIDDPSAELKSLSPTLYSIQNENVFAVPPYYFNGLEDDILSKVAPKTKVVKLKNSFVWKYAAAAILSGVIGITSLFVNNKSEKVAQQDNNIASYNQETLSFKNENQINTAISTLSKEEIIKYLENTGNETDNEVLAQSVEEKRLPQQSDYLNNEETLQTFLNSTNN